MKPQNLFFIIGILAFPGLANAASCSRANLTTCLDSVCAINATSNRAARCQYCGTSDAGTPTVSKMKSVSVGASSSYTISDKELASAPSDPGARYVWATSECLKKIDACTTDDVSDVYDTLIEQSCKAAGISADFKASASAANVVKTQSACKSLISACIITDVRCSNNYSQCETDAELGNAFSACAVDATGCDEYMSAIRSEIISIRDTTFANLETTIIAIATSYQNAREKKLSTIQGYCTDNAAYNECVANVCERSMANQCGTGYESEKSNAYQLCKFHQTACDLLK